MAVNAYPERWNGGRQVPAPMNTVTWIPRCDPGWGDGGDWPGPRAWSATEEGPNLAHIVGREWRMLAGCALLCGFLGALYAASAPRLYTSEAKLRIGSYAPIIAGAEIEDVLRQQSMEQTYTQTQIAAISGMTIADRVLSRPELTDVIERYLAKRRSFFDTIGSWSHNARETIPQGYFHTVGEIKSYLKLVSVNPVRETSLVGVSVQTRDPELSSVLANAHSEAFIDELRRVRRSAILENSSFLGQQAEELQTKVAEAERRVALYAEEHKLFAIANEKELLTRKIRTLTEQHARATSERIRLGTLLTEVKANTRAPSTIVDDDSIRNLRTALERAEASYAHLRTRFTADYPAVAQAMAKISSLRATIGSQRAQALVALEAKVKSAEQTEAALGEKIEQEKSLDHETSRKLVAYNTLQRDCDSLKDLHQNILRQLKGMQIAAAGTSTNVIITEPAVAASAPSSPKTGAILILSTVLGAVLGGCIVLVRYLLDSTIADGEELGSLGIGVLGMVPRFQDEGRRRGVHRLSDLIPKRVSLPAWASAGAIGLITGRPDKSISRNTEDEQELFAICQPMGRIAEAFRTIRTSLLLSSAENAPRSILVSSSQKGEGKTTIAANLAIVLAQAGCRTVIIDTDIRNPQLHRRFGIRNRKRGIVDYLAGQADLEDVVQETEVPGLWVIIAGPAAPNPGELLGSRKMAELVEGLSGQFDHLILDAPPILPFADSLMMSRWVEGVVMVARSHVTERSGAREAFERLRSIRAPVIGVVMNAVELNRSQRSAYGDYGRDSYVMGD